MKKYVLKKIIHLITFFNLLHGYLPTLQRTLGNCQLVFGKGMIRNNVFRSNWDQIRKRKHEIVNESRQKENKNRISYENNIGDQLPLETPQILWK
jgi:hypothetical protein